jgi:flagellar biosynthesis protein FliP
VVVISNVVNPHQNVPEPDKLLSVMSLVENHVVMVTELAYRVAILVALVILRAAISTEQDYAKRVVVLVLLTHVELVSAVMKE